MKTQNKQKKRSACYVSALLINALAASSLTAEQAQSEPVQLEGITVQGVTQENAYKVSEPKSASRLPVELADMPASIQVVPESVMRDQGAQRLEDVYKNVSGVVEAGATMNAQSEVLPFIRGFQAPVKLIGNCFLEGVRIGG